MPNVAYMLHANVGNLWSQHIFRPCFLFDFPKLVSGWKINVFWYCILCLGSRGLNRNLTNLTQPHYFKKYAYIKATCLTRQPCKNVANLIRHSRITLKKRQTVFLSLAHYHYGYFEYVNTLFRSFFKSQHRTSTNNVRELYNPALMLHVLQTVRTKAFGRSTPYQVKMFGCSRVIAHSLLRRFKETGISFDAQDRRDVRKQLQEETVNLRSRIDVSGSSRQV